MRRTESACLPSNRQVIWRMSVEIEAMSVSKFTTPVEERYFEDYVPGAADEFGPIAVTERDIIEFAARWDPQYIHTDSQRAARGPFGGLIASGWHTVCIAMRLTVDHFLSHVAHVAEAFCIEKDWLAGSSDYAAKIGTYWYKSLYQTGEKLLEFDAKGLEPQVIFVKRDRAKLSSGSDDHNTKPTNPSGTEHIGIVVRLSCRAEGGVRYQAYQLWEFAEWAHSGSRAQIKALIAFCSRAQSSGMISYTGGVLSEDSIEDRLGCKVLPVDVMKTMPSYNWHPLDCVSDDDTDKERVWAAYKRYELDDLLRKYEFKRSERLDSLLGLPNGSGLKT